MFDRLIHKYLRVPYVLHVHTERKVKRARATVLLLHGIGNSGAAWGEVIERLPSDVAVISVDLLGFGQSPSPGWAVYNTATQARSVIATLLRLNIRRKLIVIGHSMGALVAVEVTKRYPLLVRSLILCSPPFYNDTVSRKRRPNRTKALHNLYRLILKHPEDFLTISRLAKKYRLVGKTFNLTNRNVTTYMAALEASILNQTSLQDAQALQKPMHMLHGAFDPVVIKANLEQITRSNPRATLTVIRAGHEITNRYISAVVQAVEEAGTVAEK